MTNILFNICFYFILPIILLLFLNALLYYCYKKMKKYYEELMGIPFIRLYNSKNNKIKIIKSNKYINFSNFENKNINEIEIKDFKKIKYVENSQLKIEFDTVPDSLEIKYFENNMKLENINDIVKNDKIIISANWGDSKAVYLLYFS